MKYIGILHLVSNDKIGFVQIIEKEDSFNKADFVNIDMFGGICTKLYNTREECEKDLIEQIEKFNESLKNQYTDRKKHHDYLIKKIVSDNVVWTHLCYDVENGKPYIHSGIISDFSNCSSYIELDDNRCDWAENNHIFKTKEECIKDFIKELEIVNKNCSDEISKNSDLIKQLQEM
jgi:hypothetical protein